MKKSWILIILLAIVTVGCNKQESFYADNTLIEEVYNEGTIGIMEEDLENIGSSEGDIEEDVNAVDLEKDEILTEKALEEHKTEKDVLLPQDEIEENIDEDDKLVEEEVSINEDGFTIVREFNTIVPETIQIDIKYDKYATSYDYLLILAGGANIREKPTVKAKVLDTATMYEKINLIEEVKGEYIEGFNTDKWYKVFFKDGDNIKSGYILSSLGEPRTFQFDKMVEAVNKLKEEVENNQTVYISNYKNRNGSAPLYKGQNQDEYGIKRYQAAPAYTKADSNSEFRYISDGTLASVLGKENGFTKIRTLNFEGEYYVPDKYISYYNSIEELKKVVVVDRKNQNQGVFEYSDGKWKLISYVFATTGANSKYKQPTDLGYYMAIQAKDKFFYLDDVSREISGYAPYAIRFNGGAYIHGVPVEFEIVEGKKVDPGKKEYLFTIGTTPRSHKCVRNYTSHAQFLYNWIEIGKSAVIVIE